MFERAPVRVDRRRTGQDRSVAYRLQSAPATRLARPPDADRVRCPMSGHDHRRSGAGLVTNCLVLGPTSPFTPSSGDLFILEGDTGNPSDVVRFNTNRLYFFSDNGRNTGSNPAEPVAPDLADNGVPTPPNPVFLFEGADEGNNGVVFSPTSTQPGFCATCGTGVTYNIISDQTPPQLVPELGSWLLMLGGMGALALNRVRRRGN